VTVIWESELSTGEVLFVLILLPDRVSTWRNTKPAVQVCSQGRCVERLLGGVHLAIGHPRHCLAGRQPLPIADVLELPSGDEVEDVPTVASGQEYLRGFSGAHRVDLPDCGCKVL
jgi:hypothetical protein